VEYRDPIDLNHGHPSSMEIALCWYQKGTNNKWACDLINHLMIDLETIIALTTMAYIVTLDTYEFHPKDEKTFNNFIDEC
jgi:hypothetical protein